MGAGALPEMLARGRLIQARANQALGRGPLEDLIRDPTISDLRINGAHEVYIERRGKRYLSEVTFKDDNHLLLVIDRLSHATVDPEDRVPARPLDDLSGLWLRAAQVHPSTVRTCPAAEG